MGVVSTIALIIFFCFYLVDKTDGDSMTLSSGSATVGQPVTLQCAYVGSYTPFAINFYLEADIYGLQIQVSNCGILSSTGYVISLYDTTCGVKDVKLTIKSVTQGDIGKTWYCDATFSSGPSSIAKASTVITATQAASTALSSGAIAGIVIGGLAFLVANVTLIGIVLFKSGLSKQALIVLVIVGMLTAAVGFFIFLFIYMCCCKKPASSKATERLESPAVHPRTGNTESVPMDSRRLPPLNNRNGNRLGP